MRFATKGRDTSLFVFILDIFPGHCEVMWENVVNSGGRLGVSRTCT
jgi:hypothetical protein